MVPDRAALTVLDTAFADGTAFLSVWHQWRSDPQRSAMLHYVGILAEPAPAEWPTSRPPNWPEEFDGRLDGLEAGFHRILLDAGAVSLTLCIGPLQAMLTEQAMQADKVVLGGCPSAWDKWSIKALVRHCRRGTTVNVAPSLLLLRHTLEDAGFQPVAPANPGCDFTFDPRWTLSSTRRARTDKATVGHCVVIGAGLAGASVAHALALRGWRVTVLDQHEAPAGGASGLPVGLVVPHVSADDSPRSRLSRSGTRLTLEHARRLLVSEQDWAHTGVLEKREPLQADLLHSLAGWIKPAQLVRAWLQHANIEFTGNAGVSHIQQVGSQWVVTTTQSASVAADHLVFANAYGCAAMLSALGKTANLEAGILPKLAAMKKVHGLLSHGTMPDLQAVPPMPLFPSIPVNGNGSLVANIPTTRGREWFAGATFDLDVAEKTIITAGHSANHARLSELLPAVGNALRDAFEHERVSAWTGTRCVTHDRLPLVGPVQATADCRLWISAGMGARGLSFSALCAELLAAKIGNEPLPVEASLVRSLDAQRLRRTLSPMRKGQAN